MLKNETYLRMVPWGVTPKIHGSFSFRVGFVFWQNAKIKQSLYNFCVTFATGSQLKSSHKGCTAKGRREPRVWHEVWSELPENVHVVRGRGRAKGNIHSAMLRRAEGEGFEHRFSTVNGQVQRYEYLSRRVKKRTLYHSIQTKISLRATAERLNFHTRSWF